MSLGFSFTATAYVRELVGGSRVVVFIQQELPATTQSSKL